MEMSRDRLLNGWLGCRVRAVSGAGALLLALTGCGEPQAQFSTNRTYLRLQEQTNGNFAPEQVQAVVNTVTALFGTPDAPFVPAGIEGAENVVDTARLAQAAGPVHSDRYGDGAGLYRQHCVHCHGISGDGRGPTARFLNPYPRDFTKGAFKFKSTPIGIKPTEDDLRTILLNGVAGTAMPSFALLKEGELDALVDYVQYLAIRGESERRLIEEMGAGDFYNAEDTSKNAALLKDFESKDHLVEVLSEVVTSWNDAKQQATKIPERPKTYDRFSADYKADELAQSVERGRKLYYTTTANCFSCHGPAQLGDGQQNDYDQWTKEFFDWTKKNDESYEQKLAEYTELTGGFTPRNIIPRNLRSGVYRGGRRPIDIFWRINNGIDHTPMPAANKAALSDGDIWDLVNFVLSLPYDSTSQDGVVAVTNPRGVD